MNLQKYAKRLKSTYINKLFCLFTEYPVTNDISTTEIDTKAAARQPAVVFLLLFKVEIEKSVADVTVLIFNKCALQAV